VKNLKTLIALAVFISLTMSIQSIQAGRSFKDSPKKGGKTLDSTVVTKAISDNSYGYSLYYDDPNYSEIVKDFRKCCTDYGCSFVNLGPEFSTSKQDLLCSCPIPTYGSGVALVEDAKACWELKLR